MLGNELNFLLGAIGYQDLRPSYDREYLIQNATRINPAWLESITNQGEKSRDWNKITANFVISLVYGLDYILEIEPSHERIGLNLLTNYDDVLKKVIQAEDLTTLWKSLGISQVVVLLAIYPKVEGQGQIFYDKDKSVDELYGQLMDAIDSGRDVYSADIHIQVESS